MKATETYLGDGVYASFDGYQVWVYTSNGIRESERIALEPAVMKNLIGFYRHMYAIHNSKLDL